MNRKQKMLTMIALIAFVVIGACHYLDWGFQHTEPATYTFWKELTYKEAQQEVSLIKDGLERTFNDRLLAEGGYTDAKGQWKTYVAFDPTAYLAKQGITGYTDDEGQWHAYQKTPLQYVIPSDAKLWFPIEINGVKWIWDPYFRMVHPNSAMIPDVRMPWFMLGVIYVGLFFLLADKKEKRQ